QILDLLRKIKVEMSSSIMLITHDLGVIAEMADFVVVMYAGRVVEAGTVDEIFYNPVHPYTRGLQESKPTLGQKIEKLHSIPGNVPNPINMPPHCHFLDRCSYACEQCKGPYPPSVRLSETHYAVCHRALEIAKKNKKNGTQSEHSPSNTPKMTDAGSTADATKQENRASESEMTGTTNEVVCEPNAVLPTSKDTVKKVTVGKAKAKKKGGAND
ncbi:MAG: hypothetical protein FWD76_02680, partial [Firmicutes bacterium]|nr:hypothetical protein [Bacillota bacterium]